MVSTRQSKRARSGSVVAAAVDASEYTGSSPGASSRVTDTREGTTKSPTPARKKQKAKADDKEDAIDLNSRAATATANIVFLPAHQHTEPIITFACSDCRKTCDKIRRWLEVSGPPDIRELLRMDDQQLDLIPPGTKGTLIMLNNAATLNANPAAPITVFALQIPTTSPVRYFWTLLSPTSLLLDLTRFDLISPPQEYKSGPVRTSPQGTTLPPRHHTFYTILTQGFLAATTHPPSAAYAAASQISDVCPPILDPATAHARIESADVLHLTTDPSHDGKDLFDDRYLLELEPAERALASLVWVGCAEYLHVKRQYFREFSRETVVQAEKVRRAAAQRLNHLSELRGESDAAVVDDEDEDEEEEQRPKPQPRPQRSQSQPQSQAQSQQQQQQHQRSETPASVVYTDAEEEEDRPPARNRIRNLSRLQKEDDIENATASNPPSSPAPKSAPSAPTRTRTRSRRATQQRKDYADPRSRAAQHAAEQRRLRVRTQNQHFQAVQALTGWQVRNCRKLVRGWEILGFVDEGRVLGVLEGEEEGE